MQSLDEKYFNFMMQKITTSKDKAFEMECITKMLRDEYGDNYDVSAGIKAKQMLKSSEKIDFFPEGDHFDSHKCYYSVGNWIALKGRYKNVIKMKRSIDIEMWETKCLDEIFDKSLC